MEPHPHYSFTLPQKTFMMTDAPNLLPPPPSPPLLEQLQLSSSSNEFLRNQLREIFPSYIKLDNEECKFLSREDFKNHAAQAYPFIQFKFGNILSQYTVSTRRTTTTSNDGDDEEEEDQQNHHENQQQRERLYRLLSDSKKWKERTGEENVSWARVDDILKKLPVPFRKKNEDKKKYRKLKKMTIATTADTREPTTNDIPIITTITKQREAHADTRMGFRFGNMFAVKRYFTFGERMTQPGEIHVIQTSEVPFLYNEVKEEYRFNFKKVWAARPNYRNGRFDPADQKYFKTFILTPYSFYVIPENTVYLLITAQKTLFAIDRYNEVDFREMIRKDWRWKDVVLCPPNQQKELLLVQIPIPTTNVITTTLSGSKRKRNMKKSDNETAWVYNDELNPPKIFNFQNSQEDIQFIPQYYYFEEEQQDQHAYQSGDSNIPFEMVPSLDPPPPPPPPIHQNVEEVIPSLNPPPPPTPPPISPKDEVVFPTPSLDMNWDEISFPTLSSPEQKQNWDNMLEDLGNLSQIETMDSNNQPPLAVEDFSLDEIIYNTPQHKEDQLHELMEEMNQYGLDLLSN